MSERTTAAQTPLTELLRSVPRDARLALDDGPYSTTYHPVGDLCHTAADEIDRLRATPAPGAPGQEAAAVQAVGAGIIGWATHHEEPMLFPTRKEAAEYCNDDEEPIPLVSALPPSGAGEKTS